MIWKKSTNEFPLIIGFTSTILPLFSESDINMNAYKLSLNICMYKPSDLILAERSALKCKSNPSWDPTSTE